MVKEAGRRIQDVGVGLVVLAAGSSTRLGRPKQLLRFEGKSLLRRVAEIGLESCCRPVVVVLGSEAGRLRAELKDLPVETVVNSSWKQGLSSSIRCGLKALPADIRAAVLALVDQPGISARLIDRMVEVFTSGKSSLIACRYANGVLGVPALFSRHYFTQLRNLQGDRGAKPLLEKYRQQVWPLAWAPGEIDIDREEDWRRWCASRGEDPEA